MSDANPADNPAYPEAMKEIERQLLTIRRTGSRTPHRHDVFDDAVGIGLSGGGIRSATFCLGLFQGLRKQKLPLDEQRPDRTTLLSKLDYMSTVSGGGYFGAFYGRLFTRAEVTTFSSAEDVLAVSAASDEQVIAAPGAFPKGKVFRWLRENGRYLAPKGSGDLLLGFAVFLRNAIAVQIVWGVFVLMLFLLAQLMRGAIEISAASCEYLGHAWFGYQDFLVNRMPWGCTAIWWSPYTILIAISFAFLVVPPAWAYWLIEKPNREAAGAFWLSPVFGLLAVFVVASAGYLSGTSLGQPAIEPICLIVFFVAAVTTIWAVLNGWYPNLSVARSLSETDQVLINRNEQIRNHLSRQLKSSLVITVALLGFVLIDTLAQTGYSAWLANQLHMKSWSAAVFAPLLALVGFARTILSSLGGEANKKVSVPLTMIAGVAAAVVGTLVLVAFDFGAYAITWNMRLPSGPMPHWGIEEVVPGKNVTPPMLENTADSTCRAGIKNRACAKPSPAELGCHNTANSLVLPFAALLVCGLFSFLFGWSWPFLNRSTSHPIYTSRLIRAYLGATNPRRLKDGAVNVTDAIDGDDIPQDDYWPRHHWLRASQTAASENEEPTPLEREAQFYRKGAPVHLVNVTVNETIDAKSQIEQQDRKGLGMALGPAGLSVGVKHHLVLRDGEKPRGEIYPTFANEDRQAEKLDLFRVFQFKDDFHGELLSLGNWTGISGAAFSTGLGWRTSLAFSLLAGLANVRLSYWWNSGTVNSSPRPVAKLFRSIFSVQSFLFDEFLARFHGTQGQYWPLSDGGHFENMGGYELIRRHLPMIIIVDAEADGDYTFEGLANLVRKARLDFGAEIRFLTEPELDSAVHDSFRMYFGTLEQLRRGKWSEEPVIDPSSPPAPKKEDRRKRLWVESLDETLSLAHAALAKVNYENGDVSTLLYIKPTLIGDEPADVRRYHTEHPAFPHESTADQFFDEAQWESYRRLGEHIADKIFRSLDDQGKPIERDPEKPNSFLPCLMHA